ncbi:thioredoxin family protein [Litoreibacter sp.]|nr:thioredoxin family protein [Litoreibacter sp.]
MNRRIFLAAALALLPLPTLAGGATIAFDKSDPIKTALDQGKTVFVDYAADWCSTCAVQERTIGSLRSEDPAYDANIVFVSVDWDEFGRASVARDRNIPRRSTLIVLKGNRELGRIVAGTSRADIKALMDKALAAAQSS